MPIKQADVAFGVGGRVTQVMVEEGEKVTEGQPLASLDASRLEVGVIEAAAALSTAQRELALTKAGPTSEQVKVAEAVVRVAEENKRHAEIVVDQAEANVESARASVAQAAASLQELRAGPTADELEVARQKVEQAKAQLYGYQGQRDALGGMVGKAGYRVGNYEAAEGQVMATENAVTIAKLEREILAAGASEEKIDAAEAQVAQAEAGVRAAEVQKQMAQQQVLTSQRQLERARADLALTRAPVRDEQVRVAEARVEQAEAALQKAETALQDATLQAPLSGTIAKIRIDPGESVMAGTPVISLGDLSQFQVETTDLDEIDVARVREGQTVDLTFDALPDVNLMGTVREIALKADSTAGGITYRATVALEETDPRLRWGMTAFVDIEVD
jgi:HlyD family secretion protein